MRSGDLVTRIIGSTEDVNQCDHCGRTGLRRTVILDIDGERVHYGTSCAANTHPSLGKARDIADRTARLCQCGCGNFATVIMASGARLSSECVRARVHASTAPRTA